MPECIDRTFSIVQHSQISPFKTPEIRGLLFAFFTSTINISKAYLKSEAMAVCINSEHSRSHVLLFQTYFNKGSEMK